MLNLFLGKEPWFAAKTYGYGAGLPIRWQGWLLLLSYIGAMTGTGLMTASPNGGIRGSTIILFVLLTGAFMLICKRRTRGGWRWRSGSGDK